MRSASWSSGWVLRAISSSSAALVVRAASAASSSRSEARPRWRSSRSLKTSWASESRTGAEAAVMVPPGEYDGPRGLASTVGLQADPQLLSTAFAGWRRRATAGRLGRNGCWLRGVYRPAGPLAMGRSYLPARGAVVPAAWRSCWSRGPFLLVLRGRHYLPTLRGRLGRAAPPARRAPLWLHAVSVGEVGVAATLAGALPPGLPAARHHRHPDRPGAGARRCSAGRAAVAYLPFDLGFAVRPLPRPPRPARPGAGRGRLLAAAAARGAAARAAGRGGQRPGQRPQLRRLRRLRALARTAARRRRPLRRADRERPRPPARRSASPRSGSPSPATSSSSRPSRRRARRSRRRLRAARRPAGRSSSPARPWPARRRRCSTPSPPLGGGEARAAGARAAPPERWAEVARLLARAALRLAAPRRTLQSAAEERRLGRPTSSSSTPWASSPASTASPPAPSSAARSCRPAATTRSRRRASACRSRSGRRWTTSARWPTQFDERPRPGAAWRAPTSSAPSGREWLDDAGDGASARRARAGGRRGQPRRARAHARRAGAGAGAPRGRRCGASAAVGAREPAAAARTTTAVEMPAPGRARRDRSAAARSPWQRLYGAAHRRRAAPGARAPSGCRCR